MQLTKIDKPNRQECKGCHIYMDHECFFTGIKDVDKCPCKICLIKGVCHIACEEYTKYYYMWRKDRFEQSYKRVKEIKNEML